MSDHCPGCATRDEVLQTLAASEHELRDQVVSLNRALAAAERREQVAKGKLTKENTQAKEATVIYACLDVWEQHCWAGKGKPKMDINGERAGRVRKALGWGFDQRDICDGFHGLGLLPYRDKYNERSATQGPGFKRATDVVEALRDEARLERFRDYYRRVQASPSERLLERWQHATAVADELFALVLRSSGAETVEPATDERRLFVVPSPEEEAA
jgi:hypothetical protein